jgi:hypothetical protein
MCRIPCFPLLITVIGLAPLDLVMAQQEELPRHLRDRGKGQATSMFGTYIEKGDLIIYPFFEYYHDNNLEYKPEEMGYTLDADYRGKYRASEGIIFFGYGITDWLAIEFEAATISASLETDVTDTSGIPRKIEESGLGDVEGQLRARWQSETESRPELFSYFEAVSPQNRDKVLIGTSDWELKLGSGLIRGFSWGTMTVRVAGEYSVAESKFDLGEMAVEYLKRLSPAWRLYLGAEGTQDELSFVVEPQWHLSRSVALKLNNAFAITSKATDWAPEVGILFRLPTR